MLNNIQEYIIDNINNLLKFGNKDIYVITDQKFGKFFSDLSPIKIFYIEDLYLKFEQGEYEKIRTREKRTFRGGFWFFTSYRFKAIEYLMRLEGIGPIVHIENDVLVYQNLDQIKFHTDEKIILVKDSQTRCIPSIMYIPNVNLLEVNLKMFDRNKNDMNNWGKAKDVDTFPIILPELDPTLTIKKDDKDLERVDSIFSRNFSKYKVIFDGAAIGQYLGGIDPRNCPGNEDTSGFVNETCVVNYSKFKFIWRNSVPYLVYHNKEIPIICLHIHCKNLKKFVYS